VRCPTLLLHGALDRVVPPAHLQWYAARLPRARVELVPGAGHVSLPVNEAPRIAAFLRDEA
jgi:pimeloyl-ACP methyl ester carboxylesterase